MSEPRTPASPEPEGSGEPKRTVKAVNADALFDGERIDFPVSFDLRTIYIVASGGSVQSDVEGILARHGVACSMTQALAKPGASYGRFGARVTFSNREQMHAVYAEIGALPYMKAVI